MSKSSKTLAIFRRWLFYIRNRQFKTLIICPNHQKHLRYFDVGCFTSEIANSKHSSYVQIIKNTCDISTLVVLHPKSPIQNTHHMSKSSKTLAIFRRWLFYIRNRQFKTLIICPNHQKHLRYFDVGCFTSEIANSKHSSYVQIIKNTCDISTLVVLHPKSLIQNTLTSKIANSKHSSYVQIIKNTCDISTLVVLHPKSPIQNTHHMSKSSKTLAIFRRWLFYIRNRQFKTLIICPNHQKHLRYFDVGCFTSEIANSKHSSYVQIIKNTCDISTLVVLHPKSPIQNTHHMSKSSKTLAIFRRWLFYIRNRQFKTLVHLKSPIQNTHHMSTSSKTLAIFRRWLFYIRNRQFKTLIICPNHQKHLRYFDVGCFTSEIANSKHSYI